MTFPASNLPTSSIIWGREVEKRITNLQTTVSTNERNNLARDAQILTAQTRLDKAVTDLQAADVAILAAQADADTAIANAAAAAASAQSAANTANAAITALGQLDEPTSTYKLNASNLTLGTLNANLVSVTNLSANSITSGTIDANTVSVININANNITTGSISADKISAGTISASSINLTSSSYQLTVGNSSQFAYLNVQPGSANGVTLNSIGFQSTSTAGWWSNMYPYLNNSVFCGLQAFAWAGIRSVTAVVVTSDERAKNSITESDLGLNFINSLRPVSYKFNVGHNEITFDEDGQINGSVEIQGKRKHYGLVAQQVKEVLDSLNVEDFGGWILDDINDPDSTQGLRYEEFISPLIKAVQELTARIELLEGK